MSEDERLRDTQALERVFDKLSLCRGGPNDVPRPRTVAKAWTIENNDPIILGGQIDQTAGLEVLDHAAVSVQKDERFARAPFHIVEPNAVDLQKPTRRGIVVLSLFRKVAVY
jgi:hypothetical protein